MITKTRLSSPLRQRRLATIAARLLLTLSPLTAAFAAPPEATARPEEATTAEDEAWNPVEAALESRRQLLEGQREASSRLDAMEYRRRYEEISRELLVAVTGYLDRGTDEARRSQALEQLSRLTYWATDGDGPGSRAVVRRLLEAAVDSKSPAEATDTQQLSLFRALLRLVREDLEHATPKERRESLDSLEARIRELRARPEVSVEAWERLLIQIAELSWSTDPARSRRILADLAENGAESQRALASAYSTRLAIEGSRPSIRFRAVDGREVDLSSLAGKVVLIDFWATWCGPCVQELPNVLAAYEKHREAGFEIVGISFDSDRAKLETFVAERSIPWPQHFDGKGWENEIGARHAIRAIPTMWLLGRDGRVAYRDGRSDLELKVRRLFAERLPVEEGLAAWRDTGAWQLAGGVSLHSEDERRLAGEAGTGVILNGPQGRTVDLLTVAEHGDVDLHVEFLVPKGSNSGVYLMGRYEVQILDSQGVESPAHGDCGGIYQRWDPARGSGQEGFDGHAPRVNASRAPGEWQSFDITFRAPRFDAEGRKVENARFLRVVHNELVVHEDVELTGPTRAARFQDEKPTGPLMLQGDHGPVAFRNIRIRPLLEAE